MTGAVHIYKHTHTHDRSVYPIFDRRLRYDVSTFAQAGCGEAEVDGGEGGEERGEDADETGLRGEGFSILDIGANLGADTRELQKVFSLFLNPRP